MQMLPPHYIPIVMHNASKGTQEQLIRIRMYCLHLLNVDVQLIHIKDLPEFTNIVALTLKYFQSPKQTHPNIFTSHNFRTLNSMFKVVTRQKNVFERRWVTGIENIFLRSECSVYHCTVHCCLLTPAHCSPAAAPPPPPGPASAWATSPGPSPGSPSPGPADWPAARGQS